MWMWTWMWIGIGIVIGMRIRINNGRNILVKHLFILTIAATLTRLHSLGLITNQCICQCIWNCLELNISKVGCLTLSLMVSLPFQIVACTQCLVCAINNTQKSSLKLQLQFPSPLHRLLPTLILSQVGSLSTTVNVAFDTFTTTKPLMTTTKCHTKPVVLLNWRVRIACNLKCT